MSKALVLDTGVLVGIAQRSALGEAVRARHLATVSEERPFISIVTVAECRAIARHNNWALAKQQRLDALFETLTVVGITEGRLVDKYAELYAFLRANGRNFERNQNDLWIASLASLARATLLTTDFTLGLLAPEHLPVEMYDPKTGSLVERS